MDVSPFTGEAFSEYDLMDIVNHDEIADSIKTDNIHSMQLSPNNETWDEKVSRIKSNYIKEDYNTLWEDLKKLHPEIGDASKKAKYGNLACEVRAINRLNGMILSYPVFDFTVESKRKFLNWFKAHILGKGYCVYVCMQSYYPKKTALRENGDEYKDLTSNVDNVGPGFTFALDFDNIDESTNDKMDRILQNINLAYDSVRTNPRGWQKRFYLDEPCWDINFVGKFTSLALSRGLLVDKAFANVAQVLRSNGTTNNKCFVKNKDRNNQYKINLEKTTDKRMSVEYIWNAIESLPIIDDSILVEGIVNERPLTITEKKTKISQEFNDLYGDILSSDWQASVDDSVKKIFLSSIPGTRNAVMMTFVCYIKHVMCLDRDEFIILLNRWNKVTGGAIEVDKYIYNWDTYSHTDNNGKPYVIGKYLKEVAEEYGYIDIRKKIVKPRKEDVIRVKSVTDKVVLNLKVFNKDIFRKIDNNAMKLFLLMNFESLDENKSEWTQKDIIEHSYLGFSRATSIKHLGQLVELGLLVRNEKPTTRRPVAIYSINNNFIKPLLKNVELGFHETQRVIRELKGNEIKLYLLLKSVEVMNDVNCVDYSILTLSQMLGLKDNGAKDIFDTLIEKKFVRKTSGGYMHCNVYEIYS